jgi:hypothetical protein
MITGAVVTPAFKQAAWDNPSVQELHHRDPSRVHAAQQYLLHTGIS